MKDNATAPWSALTSTEVHRNRRFSVWEDKVRLSPSGEEFFYPYTRVAPGVLIVPVLNNEIILINLYRHIISTDSWELPGGAVEDGEMPAAAAARELLEETGYRAKTMSDLGYFYPSSGLSDHKVFMFAATDLEFVGQDLRSAESSIIVSSFSIQQCIDMVIQNRISSADMTLALLRMNLLKADG